MSMVVHRTDDAIEISLSARHAMQLLRDSALPGQPFYEACDKATRAIDLVLKEAHWLREVREAARLERS